MEPFWHQFVNEIEKKTSPQTFKTWFKPLSLLQFSSEKVIISVPKQFFADWLNENYKDVIKDVVFDITSFSPDIQFAVQETPTVEKQNHKEVPTVSKKTPFSLPHNINLGYTFSNFVVGASNQFAHAAALAVANNPGVTYNPLFIYGGVGLGKTHILHAIVHQSLAEQNQLKVCYVTSEQFTNELINSIRYERMPEFRKKYRNIDIILIDDIQFIAGKERTQEEFFHTFNSLFEIKKQIVVTSDKTPREIKGLEERVRNRFEWGLIADIQPPETETKVAILKKKALANNIYLPNEVAFLLADSVKSNIREMEGLLTRLSAFASFYGTDISVDFTKEVLKNFIHFDKKESSPEDILKNVSKFFNIKSSDIKGKKRNSSVVFPRQLSMYLMRKLTSLSTPEIGSLLGGRDHSTVIYSIKKVENLLQNDKTTKETVNTLLKRI